MVCRDVISERMSSIALQATSNPRCSEVILIFSSSIDGRRSTGVDKPSIETDESVGCVAAAFGDLAGYFELLPVLTIDLLVDFFRHTAHFHSIAPFAIFFIKGSSISPHSVCVNLLHTQQDTAFFERDIALLQVVQLREAIVVVLTNVQTESENAYSLPANSFPPKNKTQSRTVNEV